MPVLSVTTVTPLSGTLVSAIEMVVSPMPNKTITANRIVRVTQIAALFTSIPSTLLCIPTNIEHGITAHISISKSIQSVNNPYNSSSSSGYKTITASKVSNFIL